MLQITVRLLLQAGLRYIFCWYFAGPCFRFSRCTDESEM